MLHLTMANAVAFHCCHHHLVPSTSPRASSSAIYQVSWQNLVPSIRLVGIT